MANAINNETLTCPRVQFPSPVPVKCIAARCPRGRGFGGWGGARTSCLLLSACSLLLFASACMVGPKYQRPNAPVSTVYKELPLDASQQASNWKPAQPDDGALRGKWWEVYNDPELNALEERVNLSNQNILAAEAQFRAARDAVRIARASLFPVVSTAPSITNSRTSQTLFNVTAGNLTSGQRSTFDLPADVSYQADVWGSIRRSVRASAESAQVTAAQLENARLAYHAALAQAYFQLHGTDGERELLERTVKSYEDYLQLTKDRFASGVASGSDVAQAQTQLNSARAQLIDLGVARAQFEHAIAILTGRPPSDVSIPASSIKTTPPPIPVGIPAHLLERRPDIAAAERQMAVANEQIGIAKAAFYPAVLLSATGGLDKRDGGRLVYLAQPLLDGRGTGGRDHLRRRQAPRPVRSGPRRVRCHGRQLSPDGADGFSAGGG